MSITTGSGYGLAPMIIALLAAATFAHPQPQPQPELPAQVYREGGGRVMRELNGCATAVSAQGEAAGVVEEYRQDDDFFWLTGVSEPGAWLVLMPKAKYNRQILYLKARDPEAERWTAPREPLSPALKEKYGVDAVHRGAGSFALLRAAPAHDCLAILAPIK